jgi:hypothetical protein
MNYHPLLEFMQERHRIYIRRYSGQKDPWTDDPILREYHFCNVYRELDRTTQWISARFRHWGFEHSDFWFSVLAARLVNWVPTIEELGDLRVWDAEYFKHKLARRSERGEKVFSKAYITMSRAAPRGMPRWDYLADMVLTPVWQMREQLRPQQDMRLATWHAQLCTCMGVGSFLAGQVVADAKYESVFMDSPDWHTFAASGPGSRRGLNRVLGKITSAPWKESDWCVTMELLRVELNSHWRNFCDPPLHAQDVQASLCEYDKYCRVKEGKARIRHYRSVE